MSFTSFLSAVGKDVKAVFVWLGSPQGQATVAGVETVATTATTLINPAAGAALTGFEALFNAGLKEVISIETVAAAAGAQTGTGAQKSAAVVAAITPSVQAFLTSIGITNATAAEIQQYATALSNGIVGILNALPAGTVTGS